LDNLVGRESERLEQFRMALGDLNTPIVDAGDASMTMDPEQTAKLQSLGYTAGELNAASGADVPHPRNLIDLEPELLNAQTLMANSMWKDVEDVSRYVLTRDPKNKFALRSLVTSLTKQNRAAEAQGHAERLLELIPDSDQAFVLLAHVHVALGQPQEAYRVLTAGLEKAPESEELNYLVLVAGIESAVPDICAVRVPEAISQRPENAKFIILEARCQARADRPQDALASLTRAVDHGFKRLALLQNAPDFSAVSQLAGFQDLLERVENEKNEKGEQENDAR
jgi:tetratricopeptide (TPR) repeat protein